MEIRPAQSLRDFKDMAVQWNAKVDIEAKIYPKTGLQLKQYQATWTRASQRKAAMIGDAVELEASLPFLFVAGPEMDLSTDQNSPASLSGDAPSRNAPLPEFQDYVPVSRWAQVEATLPEDQCVRDCGGAGHCFYFCISLVLFGTVNHWLLLRRLVAAALGDNDFFVGQITPRYAQLYVGDDAVIEADNLHDFLLLDHADCDSWTDYCDSVRDTNRSATLLEAFCVASLFKIKVSLHFAAGVDAMTVEASDRAQVGKIARQLAQVGVTVDMRRGETGPPHASLVNMYGHFKLICNGDRLGSYTPNDRATIDNLRHQKFWRVTGHAEEMYIPAEVDDVFPWNHVRLLYGLTPGMAESLRALLRKDENLFSVCDEGTGVVRLSPAATIYLKAHLIAERSAWSQRTGSTAPGLDTSIEAALEVMQRPSWASVRRRPFPFSRSEVGQGTHSQLFGRVDEPSDSLPENKRVPRKCRHCGLLGRHKSQALGGRFCPGSGGKRLYTSDEGVRRAYQVTVKRPRSYVACPVECPHCVDLQLAESDDGESTSSDS